MKRLSFLFGLLASVCLLQLSLVSWGQGGGTLRNVHIATLANGRLVLVSGTPAAVGSVVEVRVEPNAGYGLKPQSLYHCHHETGGYRTEISGGASGSYTFTMPDYDTRIECEFQRMYVVRVSDEVDASKGRFEFSPSDRAFEGSTVLILPRASEGYRLKEGSLKYRYGFESWRPVENMRITMPGYDVEVVGEFVLDEAVAYEVVPDPSLGAGVIGVWPPRARAHEEVTVRVTPPRGMRYVEGSLRWCKGREKAQAESDWVRIVGGKFVMPVGTHVFVTAAVEEDATAKYSVRIDQSVLDLDAQALTAEPSDRLREGEEVLLRVRAPEGYRYDAGTLEWRRESGSEWVRIANERFAMPAENVVVRAKFSKLPKPGQRYTITYASMDGGAVQAEPGNEHLPGSRVVLVVRPQAGYGLEVGTLTVEPVGGGAALPVFRNETTKEYAFTMPEYDVVVRARFERVYTVSVWGRQDVSRGVIEISPSEDVRPQQRVVITPRAHAGNVYVEGSLEWSADQGATWVGVEGGAIVMPAAHVVVRASFAAKPNGPGEEDEDKPVYYSVRLRVRGAGKLVVRDGEGSLPQDGQVQKGKRLRISAEPASGHRLELVLVNDVPYRDSVLVVEEELTIEARFARDEMAAVGEEPVVGYWPNPFGDALCVSLRGWGRVELLSVGGVVVRAACGEGLVQLDGALLPSGVYLLRVRPSSGVSWVYRVVRR